MANETRFGSAKHTESTRCRNYDINLLHFLTRVAWKNCFASSSVLTLTATSPHTIQMSKFFYGLGM